MTALKTPDAFTSVKKVSSTELEGDDSTQQSDQ